VRGEIILELEEEEIRISPLEKEHVRGHHYPLLLLL
jgi:hypothetical protein